MKRLVFLTLLVFALGSGSLSNHRLWAAEYQGKNIDGERFDCTAYSYSTSKYYYGHVEFNGDEATVYLPSGGYVLLTLDDEELDDPSSISAFDYKNSVFWDLEVDELE